jgi:ribokinase
MEIIMSKKIIVVGSSNTDITGRAERLPRHGETVMGTTMMIGPGGKGLNQATAAHLAAKGSDCETVFISRIGNDAFGKVLVDHMSAVQMNTSGVIISDTDTTGCAIIEIEEDSAQNRIMVIPGANSCLSAEDIRNAETLVAKSSAVLTQLEISLDTVKETKELAKKYNKPFILNPAPAAPLSDELLCGIDWFTPNETEAAFYAGGKEPDSIDDVREIAQLLLKKGIKNVVITLGSRGAYWTDGKDEIVVPSRKVKAVDTVGAGDTFNGALAVAIAEELDGEVTVDGVARALDFANRAAGISVTRKGAASSCPTREEILNF